MDYERVDQLLWSPFPHTGLKWIFGSLAHSRLETLDIKIEIAPILDYSRLTHRSPTTSFQSVAELNASITFDRNKITFQTTKSWKGFLLLTHRVHLRIHFSPLSWLSCFYFVCEFEVKETIKVTQTASRHSLTFSWREFSRLGFHIAWPSSQSTDVCWWSWSEWKLSHVRFMHSFNAASGEIILSLSIFRLEIDSPWR